MPNQSNINHMIPAERKKNPTTQKKFSTSWKQLLGKPGMTHEFVNTQAFSFSFVALFEGQSDKSAGLHYNNNK